MLGTQQLPNTAVPAYVVQLKVSYLSCRVIFKSSSCEWWSTIN